MATITQSISNFPTAPDSSTDTPTEFNTKADAFVNHQSSVYVGEVNTWATQANAVRDDINNISASIPSGTIDDINISNTKVYSNSKAKELNDAQDALIAGRVIKNDYNPTGITLDETTTPKLSELNLVGTSPQAILYPDGSIVGSTSNGRFTLYPNGDAVAYLLLTGTSILINNAYGTLFQGITTLFYPISPMTSAVVASGAYQWAGSASWGNVLSISNNKTIIRGIDILLRGTGDQTSFVSAVVHGRWK